MPDVLDRARGMRTAQGGPTLAYVLSRFPKLTETFVFHEILEMQRLGVRVHVYPLLRHEEAVTQHEAEAVRSSVRFAGLVSLSMARAHWHFLVHRPWAYLRVLVEVLRGTAKSRRALFGALWFFPRAVWCAYDATRAGVDHIHAQFAYHPTVAALVMHRLGGIPYSFTARGSDIHVDPTMLGEKLAAAEFAIAVSEFNREVLLAAGGPGSAGKVHVIYGGIDTERFRPQSSRRAPGDAWRILCVSRFEEVKGHAQLIEACRLLMQRGLAFECHLVGEGELREAIRAQVAAAGLEGRVSLYPACSQDGVLQHLSRADVFVLATVPASDGKREGIPNVLKEAMACGLPVVASDMAGIPELVRNCECGLLVPPGDVRALADTLQRLLQDRALAARLGRAARERIVSDFNLGASTRRRAQLFFPAVRTGGERADFEDLVLVPRAESS